MTTIVERLTHPPVWTEQDARRHVQHGRVKVDGQVVTDPDHPVDEHSRIVIHPLTLDEERELPELDDEPEPAPVAARPARKRAAAKS